MSSGPLAQEVPTVGLMSLSSGIYFFLLVSRLELENEWCRLTVKEVARRAMPGKTLSPTTHLFTFLLGLQGPHSPGLGS